jgi:hypothetical protein
MSYGYSDLFNEVKNYSFNPKENKDIQYLTIMACHTNGPIKYNAVLNNMHYLTFPNNDIVIINSTGHGEKLKTKLLTKVKMYYEIPNDNYFDFGKWVYVLKNYDISNYNFIVFINDSFIIRSPINHYYNLLSIINKELYGYTDSCDYEYHYQSYLFAVKKYVVPRFVAFFESKKNKINCFEDVITNLEVKMAAFFQSRDCFLKLTNNPQYKGNIFFVSDTLYKRLFLNKLLPFIKVKRLLEDEKEGKKLFDGAETHETKSQIVIG